MRSSDGHLSYLAAQDLTKAEREILTGFIDQRNAIKPTGTRTKGKQAYEGARISRVLHENGADLHSCTVHDLLKVAGEASSGKFTRNTRQTKIVTLKALANYIHRFHHQIPNLDLLTGDVKAGSVEKNTKVTITREEWGRLRALPMSAKSRAELYMMYYGYHRPGELTELSWSDLEETDGGYEYTIKFKTEKSRTVVMRAAAVEVLEKWRMECGALPTDETPIFPAPDGKPYHTITHLAKLFNRLKKQTGIKNLMPSILRNSAMQHDLEAGYPVSYVCLVAWGEPYNELINLYTKPDSAKIQRDQHAKAGDAAPGKVLGTSREFTTTEDRIRKLEMELEEVKNVATLMVEFAKERERRNG